MAEDFSGQNLRGRSFKGQDLTGANFSYADIRGADFTNAILRNANFSHAKAGLQRRWVIVIVIVSFLLAAISGLISAITGFVVEYFFHPDTIKDYTVLPGFFLLVVLTVFFIVAIRQGLNTAFTAVAVAAALAATMATVVAPAVAVAVGGVVAVAAAAAAAVAGAVAAAVAGAGAVAVAAALAAALAKSVTGVGGGIATVAVATAFISLSAYISWRALAGDKKYAVVRRIAVAFAATGGTSFRRANLTDANFTQATLRNTDLRKAIVTRTCWLQAKKLDRARVGETYLQNSQVRCLVVTGAGQDRNFDSENLQGVNLRGANLVDASFIGVNLNHANLQEANLSRAKLVQTQLDQADLTGACLTGAYIQDWNITTATILDRVECQYVYMRLPTRENPDPCRKPDNNKEVFETGDFADFIKPIVETLDLYHNQGVDPRAIAISLKRLVENNPEAKLDFKALEKRGLNNLLLRLNTTEGANHSKLSAEYFSDYNQLKFLPENDVRLLIAAQDKLIQSFENMVNTALNRPSFYIETYQHQGDIMPENSDININAGGNVGAVGRGDVSNQGLMNFGTISGNVTNAINQLPDSPHHEQAGIKELLTQLQTAIEAENDLPQEDKVEALEQVKVLAEAGKNPQEGAMRKMGKTAIKILKGTVAGLPNAAKLVEECNKLLPLISKLLGLG